MDSEQDAGFAGKPLAKKLGFEPGDSVFVEDTPDWYSEFADDNRIDLEPGLPATHAHIFCGRKAEITSFLKDNELEDIEKYLWLSWPKQSSKMKSDITEQDLRDAVLPKGWVDVKVAAIDDVWSGLKFVRRKQ